MLMYNLTGVYKMYCKYFDCPLYHELCDTYSMRNPDLLRSPAPGGGHFFTPGHGTDFHLIPGGGTGIHGIILE